MEAITWVDLGLLVLHITEDSMVDISLSHVLVTIVEVGALLGRRSASAQALSEFGIIQALHCAPDGGIRLWGGGCPFDQIEAFSSDRWSLLELHFHSGESMLLTLH